MKIYYSLPTMSDLLKHDGPLLKIVTIGATAFVILSSATTFAGFALHFALEGWKLWAYGIAIYPLLSLAPDLINLVCLTWVVRTLLKWGKLQQDIITTSILIVVCLAISGLCTWYSFSLSKISSVQIADWMKPKTEVAAQLDSTLINQTANILNMDSLSTSGRASAIDNEQKAVIRVFDNQIKALVADSIYWERYKTDDNHQWVDRRKLDGIKAKLTALRLERDTNVLALVSNLNTVAGSSASLKDTINNLLLMDAKVAIQRKQEEQERKDNQHEFITKLVSSIAGYAVLILLPLGCVREILYSRNDIEPLPIIGPFDFQNFEHVKEVIAYPVAWAGRHIINATRRRYSALPELEEPAFESFAFNHDVKTEVVQLKPRKRRIPQQERQGIGFKMATSSKEAIKDPESPKASITNATITNGLPQKGCFHCGQPYVPKVGWQKFCTKDCQMEHHAQKHGGQKFNAKKFHKKS